MTYDEYKKHLEACGPLDDISKGLLSAFELGYGQGVIDRKSLTTKALAQPEQILTARVVVTGEKQEPAAWLIQYKTRHDIVWGAAPGLRSNDQILGMEPLYTAPPKREWVGLTDEEFKFIASKYSLPTQTGMEYFKDELEAKLKEKNS